MGNGVRGLATAMVMKPDVVVCRCETDFISTTLIRCEVRSINIRCKFLIIDD
ncbi:MAG: hypothetical protein LBJ94_03675 [Puniceicoccales bacterium]|nr:hypothetical protein [Puniceicoccales bacterium]